MKSERPKRAICEDCGGEGIYHRLTYFNIVLDEAMASVLPPLSSNKFLMRMLSPIERWASAHAFYGTFTVGLVKKQDDWDDKTQLLAQCLWEEAKKRGITMWEWRLFGLARNIFVARYPNGKLIAFEGIPAAKYEDERVEWMDDKARLKKEFLKRGLPVAKGGDAKTEKEALALYHALTTPVIVKPHSGSGSRHTVLHITDEAELLRAFRIAKQVAPRVVIEEELVGPVYRATVVDGKFQAALRRDPPSVVGDGVHTVAELVELENQKPARSGPIFSKVLLYDEAESDKKTINEKAAAELVWQKLTPESVPEKGRRVYFHQKVNWSVGGTTADVTDEVHPDNRALFERAAHELKAPITGIDFIIGDISKSWKEQDRCGILECNSMPFFDNHHLPFEGEPRNIAAAIWDMVTPKAKPRAF